MFKENSANKLIEYIQTLPAIEQKLIAEGIVNTRDSGKQKKSVTGRGKKTGAVSDTLTTKLTTLSKPKGEKQSKKSRLEKIKRFQRFVEKQKLNVPADFKFNREEANKR